MHELLISKGRKPKTGTVAPCGTCGKDVYRNASFTRETRFCSSACKHTWQRTSTERACQRCGALFLKAPSEPDIFCSRECYEGTRKVYKQCAVCGGALSVSARTYCSPECWATAQRTGAEQPCKICGNPVYVKPHQDGLKQYCSLACQAEGQRIQGAGASRQRSDGYIEVYFPKHPDANSNGMMMQHRLVMEEMIGRRLETHEHVHHKNGVKNDNEPPNLELLNIGDHSRLTLQIAKKKRASAAEEVARIRAENAEYRRRFGPLTSEE